MWAMPTIKKAQCLIDIGHERYYGAKFTNCKLDRQSSVINKYAEFLTHI